MLASPNQEKQQDVTAGVLHQGVRGEELRGIPDGTEEVCGVMCGLLPGLLHHPGEGQVSYQQALWISSLLEHVMRAVADGLGMLLEWIMRIL